MPSRSVGKASMTSPNEMGPHRNPSSRRYKLLPIGVNAVVMLDSGHHRIAGKITVRFMALVIGTLISSQYISTRTKASRENDDLPHGVTDGRSIVEAYTKRRLPPDFSNSPPTRWHINSSFARAGRRSARVANSISPSLYRRQVFARLKPLLIPKCPFVNLPETHKGRWGEGLTAADMDKCVWVRPEIVARIEFLEWTGGDHLRHAKFAGLRDDKDARTVIKEHGAEG